MDWNDFLQRLQAAGALVTAAAGLATVWGITLTYKQLKGMDRQFHHQKNFGEAQMFKQISDSWGGIYKSRNKLLTSDPKDVRYFETKYANYVEFLSSEEWLEDFRPLCAFFEMIGVLLHRGHISEDDLFVLVTVDIFHRVNGAENQKIDEGVIYSKLKGPIEYLRKHYRSDIYFYYDNCILEKYKKRTKLTPSAARSIQH